MIRVLVVGDVMLDRFVYGDVRRISPEAPTPILQVRRVISMPGGAGNVALGIAALGADASLIAVVGHDKDGHTVNCELTRKMVAPLLIFDKLRPTTTKTRYVSIEHSTHLLRVDQEVTTPISTLSEDMILRAVATETNRPHHAECIVLSDYAKGVLTSRVIEQIILNAKVPVIVDPKRSDLTVYRGATVITPNLKELGLPLDATDEDIQQRVETFLRMFDNVLVTRGEHGMILFGEARSIVRISAHAVRVRDVSGAGDTVVAALATGIAQGMNVEDAARRANDAAALAVSKFGTAVVTLAELAAPRGKIVFSDNWTLLDQRVAEWQVNGERIGFTNGCFDLIHPGHVKLLNEARAMCDKLVVGLNSDVSTRALKGPDRPIQNEAARAEVLAAMDAVDLVVIFDNETPIRVIERVMPDVLVKGSDYRAAEVVGADIAKKVVIVDRLPGHSTTRLIHERVRGTRASDL